MADARTFIERCKEVFLSKRSNSLPCSSAQVKSEEATEGVTGDFECKRNTLRRSKSGRVKPLARTRSLVSSYDFNRQGQVEEESAVAERADIKAADALEEDVTRSHEEEVRKKD